MRIGVEVEFFTLREGLPFNINAEEFNLKLEYYNGMYEQTYLFEGEIDHSTIKKDLEHIAQKSETSIPLKSILIPIPGGAASCGIHIHLDIDTIKDYSLCELLLVYNKFKTNPSMRFLHSHHIWGHYRNCYTYGWKKKLRYRPVAFSPEREDKPSTWEIRIYDLEDLWNGVVDRGLRIVKYLLGGRKPSRKLMKNAEKTMETLLELDAEKMFGYDDIDEESARLLYKILNKRCPAYEVVGYPVSVKPRFYSITTLDRVAINERIFEKINEKEEVTCAV